MRSAFLLIVTTYSYPPIYNGQFREIILPLFKHFVNYIIVPNYYEVNTNRIFVKCRLIHQ